MCVYVFAFTDTHYEYLCGVSFLLLEINYAKNRFHCGQANRVHF